MTIFSDTQNAWEIVISGVGDYVALEKKILGLIKDDVAFKAEFRTGGPNPQNRPLGTYTEPYTTSELKKNEHGEAYAAAGPPPLVVTGQGMERLQSVGPLSPSPEEMKAAESQEEGGSSRSARGSTARKGEEADTGEDDTDDDEETDDPMDREYFQGLTVAEAGEFIDSSDDKKQLRQFRRWEQKHPKHEGGRQGILSRIDARLESL